MVICLNCALTGQITQLKLDLPDDGLWAGPIEWIGKYCPKCGWHSWADNT